VSFVDEVQQSRPDGASPTQELPSTQQPSHEETLGAHVVAANEVLVSEDVTEDPRFADDPLVLEKGIRFYAGAPLRTSAGLVIGTLCVIDTRPREFPELDRQRLQDMANELMRQIERRSTGSPGKAQADLVTFAGTTR
jgi:GAF domain-containing protein